ncbi:M protein trans-acting positive regulator, partial [Enterococcus faecalis]|nr:M protein trans-acting positive regulator [Enterococcus faecalis]
IHFYYDFLFLLLSKIPLNELEKTIVICVDFSYGKAYTELITAQIEGFNNLTLKIEHKLTEKTDLYISDVAMSREKLEQIIWKNPPTPEDWKYFGEKIIEIKGREHFA